MSLPRGFEVKPIPLALILMATHSTNKQMPFRLRVEFGCVSGYGLRPVALHFGYLRRGTG